MVDCKSVLDVFTFYLISSIYMVPEHTNSYTPTGLGGVAIVTGNIPPCTSQKVDLERYEGSHPLTRPITTVFTPFLHGQRSICLPDRTTPIQIVSPSNHGDDCIVVFYRTAAPRTVLIPHIYLTMDPVAYSIALIE